MRDDGDTFSVTHRPLRRAQGRAPRSRTPGITVDGAELTLEPSVTVPVEDEGVARQVLRLIDALEDSDDVQTVYANFDIPDRVMEAVA